MPQRRLKTPEDVRRYLARLIKSIEADEIDQAQGGRLAYMPRCITRRRSPFDRPSSPGRSKKTVALCLRASVVRFALGSVCLGFGLLWVRFGCGSQALWKFHAITLLFFRRAQTA